MPDNAAYIFGPAMAVVLALVASWLAWRQFQLLASLKRPTNLAADDVRFYRRAAFRRIFGCLLMFALAVLLAGLFGAGIIERLDALMAQGDQAKVEGRTLTDEERRFVLFSLSYVGGMAAVLFAMLVVAFFDVLAIRKFGNRHRRRIREDRAAMLERQLPELYRERQRRRESLDEQDSDPSAN